MSSSPQKSRIDTVSGLFSLPVRVDVLRLDLLDPVISGNKSFKLKKYIAEAKASGKRGLVTFGGAYSNHIVAMAAAANHAGLQSIGIIRGEEPKTPSHTLLAAKNYGMQLHFVSREQYRKKYIPPDVYSAIEQSSWYEVPEGGYGLLGMTGAKDILLQNDTSTYSHILCAVGTGTTLAGLIAAAQPQQKVIGIPVLKNALSLRSEIEYLLPTAIHNKIELIEGYHFGGYAKQNNELLTFMNSFYNRTNIPTDFVYTGKAFFAAVDLMNKNHFPAASKLLLIHTGGLQGNASLKKGALIF